MTIKCYYLLLYDTQNHIVIGKTVKKSNIIYFQSAKDACEIIANVNIVYYYLGTHTHTHTHTHTNIHDTHLDIHQLHRATLSGGAAVWFAEIDDIPTARFQYNIYYYYYYYYY